MESCTKTSASSSKAISSFLKFQKIENFFDSIGDIVIEGTGRKGPGVKNLKFFKILIFYSEGFVDFIKYVTKNKFVEDETKLVKVIEILN